MQCRRSSQTSSSIQRRHDSNGDASTAAHSVVARTSFRIANNGVGTKMPNVMPSQVVQIIDELFPHAAQGRDGQLQASRPLIGAFAPGHHGYQRACVLIAGQASIGPFGSPVFACAGKTDPPSLLILSQTSAGSC